MPRTAAPRTPAPLPPKPQGPVPTFAELLRQNELSQADFQDTSAQTEMLGVTPVDDEGHFLEAEPSHAPRINLLNSSEVEKPWTETFTAETFLPKAPTPIPLITPLASPPAQAASKPTPVPRAFTPSAPSAAPIVPPTPAVPQTRTPRVAPLPIPNPPLRVEKPSFPLAPEKVSFEPILSVPQTVALEIAEDLLAPKTQTMSIVAEPTSGWRLVGSWAVDAALLGGLLAGGLQVLAAEQKTSVLQVLTTPERALKLGMVGVGLAWLYATACARWFRGQSFGRLCFGIQLVDDEGQPPSVLRAAVRATLAWVSMGIFLGGYWMALVSDTHQTLHDKLTSIFPVRVR